MSFFPSIIRELRIQAVGFTKLITVTSEPRIWQYHKYMESFWEINIWMLFPGSSIWPWIDFCPLYFFKIYLLFSPGMFPSMTCHPGKHEQEEDPHLEFHLELSKLSQFILCPQNIKIIQVDHYCYYFHFSFEETELQR